MANRLWKQFDRLTEKCYDNMIGVEKDPDCWQQAFEVLKEVVLNERESRKDYARELYLLDEETDYAHDIGGWMEDYLDEMDMRQEYEVLLKSCDWLLEHFAWVEDSATDLYFTKSVALSHLGRKREACDFCLKWMEMEPDNEYAAAAAMYAEIKLKDFSAAEEIFGRFVSDNTPCDEENEALFTAAEQLYKQTGNREKRKWVQDAMKAYEEEVENELMNFKGDGFDDPEDWELPFN